MRAGVGCTPGGSTQVGLLVRREKSSMGCALLFKVLLDYLGFENKIVRTNYDQYTHNFNIVTVGGRKYLCDTFMEHVIED